MAFRINASSISRRAITRAWISAAPSEDREDARVTQNPADRIFQREAIATVNLERIVGSSPGNPGGEQLGHAGLRDRSALSASFSRPGEIGDLARDMDLGGHHGELVGHAREGDQRLAELDAVLRDIADRDRAPIAPRRRPARRRLDTRGFGKSASIAGSPRPQTSPSKFAPATAKPSKDNSYSFMPR